MEEPETLSARIDFTIDAEQGRHVRTPLEQLAGLLTQVAQGFVWVYLVATPLATLLTSGVEEVERRLRDGFAGDERVAGLGIAISAVSVLAVRPTPEVERALQTPELERVQAAADKATFERRAAAVEQERAIAENELQSRIELSRREESLVDQERLNDRKRAEAGPRRRRSRRTASRRGSPKSRAPASPPSVSGSPSIATRRFRSCTRWHSAISPGTSRRSSTSRLHRSC